MRKGVATRIVAGFYGKLTARGDFVNARVPRSFTVPWDAWLQVVLPSSQDLLGEAWAERWRSAPPWRFALPNGVCGPDAALGLFVPSADRVGRRFPLTFFCSAPGLELEQLLSAAAAFRHAADRARRAAEAGLAPADVSRELDCAMGGGVSQNVALPSRLLQGTGLWWTEATIGRPARTLELSGLPDAETFASMLDRGGGGPQ